MAKYTEGPSESTAPVFARTHKKDVKIIEGIEYKPVKKSKRDKKIDVKPLADPVEKRERVMPPEVPAASPVTPQKQQLKLKAIN